MKKKSRLRPVWMIIANFYPGIGGAERQAQRLSKALIARGWPVRVLTRQHSPALPQGLPASDVVDGIPVIRLYSRGAIKIGSLLFVLGGLWHLLRHGSRGIYHAHDIGAPSWLALVARYLLGGRCIIKLRTGCYRYEKRCSSRVARWQFCALLRLADRVVVVSREVERFVCNLGIPAARVIRIPNSVDTSLFYPISAEERIATRKQLGLPTEKTIVLYVGVLKPIKGTDILLRAWALLPVDIRTEALLLLVGDGAERANLLRMITSLRLHESVFLAGMQQAVRDYYWAADIFVLPSRTEGLSNALVEAMACGLPVIASNVGGTLDVVEEGQNGVLFEAENHHQLAQKLASMIAMQERWVQIGALARQRVKAYADLDMAVDRLHQLYNQLL